MTDDALVEAPAEETAGFASLGLRAEILRAVEDSGYTRPTEIQCRAIPEVIGGRNIVGIAQTGTGKTASFVLPMLHMLAAGRARARMPRSLILSPTRELATQTASNFENYGKYLDLSMVLIIGGVGMGDQEKALEKGVDVLIATPGRLLDWFERGKLLLGGVDVLVIDEADRMLDMGFLPDIERILTLLLGRKQTLLFSATMPPEISRLTDRFLADPLKIEVARPATTSASIEDVLVPVKGGDKRSLLAKLIGERDIQKAIVFCNRKRDVGSLTRHLQRKGMNARDLHGDLDQAHRQATLNAFKGGEVDFLVATDVAARGLDISDMPVVVNFDVPMNADDYVHRIGRTGRAGKTGRAFTLTTPQDFKFLQAIEKSTGRTLNTLELVADDEVAGEFADEDHTVAEGIQVPFLRAPRSRRRARTSSEAPSNAASGRSRTRRRSARMTEDAPSEETASSVVESRESQETSESAPRPSRRRSSTRRKQDSESAPIESSTPVETSSEDKAAKPARTASRRRGRSKSEEDEPKVVGLGDHVPSFLLRPVPLGNSGAAEAD